MPTTRSQALAAAALSLPLLVLLLAIVSATGGHFSYSLDDPYIHLALARNILAGHYGLSAAEMAAPSSSVLWPFLLAPFALEARWFEFAPLVLNSICFSLTAFVMLRIFAAERLVTGVALTFTLLFSLNGYGLVFTGMEHSLQVLLVAVILLALLDRRAPDRGFLAREAGVLAAVCVVVLPLVRYEGLAVSLPVLAYLWMRGERRVAVLMGAAIAATLIAFSLFLYTHDLGVLPSSVMAKSPTGLRSFAGSVLRNLDRYGFMLIPVALLAMTVWSKEKGLAVVVGGATVLQFVFGRYGWMGRYEVYWLAVIFIVALKEFAAWTTPKVVVVSLLPLAFAPLVAATIVTPIGASNIQHQQGQMAEIIRILRAPVALNDIGLVSLRSGVYVLDLWGLASTAALEARRENPGVEWMAVLMEERRVRYAVVYDAFFPEKPDNWRRVGVLTLNERLVSPAFDRVSFYATDATAEDALRQVLVEYRRAHPSAAYSIFLDGE